MRFAKGGICPLERVCLAPQSALASTLTQDFHYDAAGRLVAAEVEGRPDLSERYAYDKSGNIARKTARGETATMTCDSANELVANAGEKGAFTRYEYDNCGENRRQTL